MTVLYHFSSTSWSEIPVTLFLIVVLSNHGFWLQWDTFLELIDTVPDRQLSSPRMVFSSVVLPDPKGLITITRLPLVTLKDTSVRAIRAVFCEGKMVMLSKAMATSGSVLSEVNGRNSFLPTQLSFTGSDTIHSWIRWKHPIAAAIWGKTASSLSAGVVTG